jgi:Tfp pilus assembly protein PilN
MNILKSKTSSEPKPFAPTAATVNLLPDDIREIAAVQRARQHLIVAGSVVVIAIGALFAAQTGSTIGANNALDKANEQHAALVAQQDALDPVAQYYAEVAQNQETIKQAMSKEVLFSTLTKRLAEITPAGVAVETVNVTVDTRTADPNATAAPSGTNCPGPNPFNPGTTVGCATMTGKAVSRDGVGSLIDVLNADPLFEDAFVTTTTADTESGEVSFVATVGVSDDVFSGRYKNDDFIQGVTK